MTSSPQNGDPSLRVPAPTSEQHRNFHGPHPIHLLADGDDLVPRQNITQDGTVFLDGAHVRRAALGMGVQHDAQPPGGGDDVDDARLRVAALAALAPAVAACTLNEPRRR